MDAKEAFQVNLNWSLVHTEIDLHTNSHLILLPRQLDFNVCEVAAFEENRLDAITPLLQ